MAKTRKYIFCPNFAKKCLIWTKQKVFIFLSYFLPCGHFINQFQAIAEKYLVYLHLQRKCQ